MLVDGKNDKEKSHIIHETNEGYISVVTYGCLRFIVCCRFLSTSFDWLVSTLVDNSHKAPKETKKEFVADDEVLNNANEIKLLASEDRTIEVIKKDFADEIEKLKDALGIRYLKLIWIIWKQNSLINGNI